MLLDSHFHLDFLTTAARDRLLNILRKQDVEVVPQTLTPGAFAAQRDSHSLLSLGFHPWNIESAQQAERQLHIFSRELENTRFIGEIGLDFSPRRLERTGQELQEYTLRQIFQMLRERAISGAASSGMSAICAASAVFSEPPLVLSIHAVRAAGRVLDLLEETGLAELTIEGIVAPVFHWFSGSGDELTRLRRMSCYVSVNPRMLTTKRGRAYARQLPVERLLLETDLPEHAGVAEAEVGTVAITVLDTLRDTVALLGELRGEDVLPAVLENQRRLYGIW